LKTSLAGLQNVELSYAVLPIPKEATWIVLMSDL